MIESIDFISKDRAELLRGDPLTAIISISDPDESVALAPEFHSVLSIKFLDIEFDHPHAFNPKMAAAIIKFIKQIHKERQFTKLVVHCHAGISRSAAVALVAHAMTGADFERRQDACYANIRVAQMLSNKSGCAFEIPERPDLSDYLKEMFL